MWEGRTWYKRSPSFPKSLIYSTGLDSLQKHVFDNTKNVKVWNSHVIFPPTDLFFKRVCVK